MTQIPPDTRTVLVVDDSKVSRSMAMALLGRRLPDARFLEAGSGAEGFEAARSTELALVLMDYNMPGVNGVDAALAIRKLQPDVPVVLLTANGQAAVQAKADAAGIHVLRKPIKPELADRIASFLKVPA